MSSSIIRRSYIAFLLCLASLVPLATIATAQAKSQPGKYDFYLLNLSWSSDFCSIQGTGPQCKPPAGFVLHGLWPQNNDGTWPASCADRPGPAHPEENLDITPDLSLLQHEWNKHGTCTLMDSKQFFALEHRAFQAISIPTVFLALDHTVTLTPASIVAGFRKANPSYPADSIVVSCKESRLTAVEACLSKDGLKPIGCRNIEACDAEVIQVVPGTIR